MKVKEICTGLKIVGNGYTYSNESILQLEGQTYSLRQKASYGADGTITKLIVYKPEGILEYSQQEIFNDRKILDYTGLPFHQKWFYANGHLLKGDTIINKVEKVNNGTLKFEKDNRAIFYKIN